MQLRELHPQLSRPEKAALAEAAGITPAYLAQLATGFRTKPSLKVCAALVAHDSRLTLEELAQEFADEEKA